MPRSNTKHTEQHILNESFDEIGLVRVNNAEYSPDGSVAHPKITDNLAFKYATSGTELYIGEATPGASSASPIWRIMKFDSSTQDITWADGDASFDNVWDDYASLTYL